MGTRRTAREQALQILFQLELNPQVLEEAFDSFWVEQRASKDTQAFARFLAQGTFEKKQEIDEMIRLAVTNWDMDRLSVIDRNILRVGVFEMIFLPQGVSDFSPIPHAVTINEWVEIAKKYSAPESGKFVNGVLDEVRKRFLLRSRPQ